MTADQLDAYFAARLAFVDLPGVRICTRPADDGPGLWVHADDPSKRYTAAWRSPADAAHDVAARARTHWDVHVPVDDVAMSVYMTARIR